MKTLVISPKQYIYLFIALLIVYIPGLFIPLMDRDQSHHADIALHMYRSGNYTELISSGEDYLDKPHLFFWAVAGFFHLFGVTTLAYKLPSFLVTCLGLYSTYRLGKLLYNTETGIIAALMTACAHAFILANTDVRMDAMLTGFVIFGTWQLSEAVYLDKWLNYFGGALGMALAFPTKGMIGIAMPALAAFFLIAYQRNWRQLFNPKWLVVLILLGVFISPVLYCYYLQFDLHPEKEIRGRTNISGIKFILWDQSSERFAGTNFGKGRVKPFFFLHTMLWAFLPWAFIAYYAILSKATFFLKRGFTYVFGEEFLTLGTVLLIFIILSMAGFQLPHYLNPIFPFLGIITAQKLLELHLKTSDHKYLEIILKFQYVIIAGCVLVAILLNLWVFPIQSIPVIAAAVFVLFVLSQHLRMQKPYFHKIIFCSSLSIIFANVLLNGNFYPKLLQYQSGSRLAKVLVRKNVDNDKVYKFNATSYDFDFYYSHIVPFANIEDIKSNLNRGEDVWLYTNDEGKDSLEQAGIPIKLIASALNARITKLKPKFLNPKTRAQACHTNFLIKTYSREIADK